MTRAVLCSTFPYLMGVMNFGGKLEARLEVRLDEETKAELERQAAKEDRKPAALARRFIRDGLRAARQEESYE